jgi:hypothetical protein
MIREARIGQRGFFDAERRLAALSAKGDPLEAIDRLVPWEGFRTDIEAVVLTPEDEKKSSAGRKPIDAIVLLRMFCNRSTICRTNRWNSRCATGCRSRGFCGCVRILLRADSGFNARPTTAVVPVRWFGVRERVLQGSGLSEASDPHSTD